jgi:hypothetical protein
VAEKERESNREKDRWCKESIASHTTSPHLLDHCCLEFDLLFRDLGLSEVIVRVSEEHGLELFC